MDNIRYFRQQRARAKTRAVDLLQQGMAKQAVECMVDYHKHSIMLAQTEQELFCFRANYNLQ